MVVAGEAEVVEVVVVLGDSDVSDGKEEVVEVALEVVVVVVVVVVSVPGAGGKPCASTTLPDGTNVVVSVGAGAIVVVTASAAEVEVAETLSLLSDEQAAASKAAVKAIAITRACLPALTLTGT